MSHTVPDSWPQLVLETSPDDLPELEAGLFEAGALSVTLTDCEDEPVLEPEPGEVRLWQALRVTALFARDIAPEHILEQLQGTLGNRLPECRFEHLADTDWERSWMSRFHAMQFGERFWVCPSHIEPPDPQAVNLRLDPGLAFGSGTHPTTALCLEWLAGYSGPPATASPSARTTAGAKHTDLPFAGQTLVDYGCGSGILAVAAAMLGAQQVVALDIDPQALIATRDNAERNQVSPIVRTERPDSVILPGADIMVANILYAPLMQLAEEFTKWLKPGGVLVLSGILQEQVDALMLHYTQWFSFKESRLLDDWALLEASLRPGHADSPAD